MPLLCKRDNRSFLSQHLFQQQIPFSSICVKCTILDTHNCLYAYMCVYLCIFMCIMYSVQCTLSVPILNPGWRCCVRGTKEGQQINSVDSGAPSSSCWRFDRTERYFANKYISYHHLEQRKIVSMHISYCT